MIPQEYNDFLDGERGWEEFKGEHTKRELREKVARKGRGYIEVSVLSLKSTIWLVWVSYSERGKIGEVKKEPNRRRRSQV